MKRFIWYTFATVVGGVVGVLACISWATAEGFKQFRQHRR